MATSYLDSRAPGQSGLDLFAATIEGLTDSPARLREVTRSRENFIEEYESAEPVTISSYFDKFAHAARIEAQNK